MAAIDARTSASSSASPDDQGARRSRTSSSCSRTVDDDRLEEDVDALAELLAELGALDVYVLPAGAPARS